MKTHHYVTFFSAGTFFANTHDRSIDHRDPARVDVPDGVYAFRFYDRTELTLDSGEVLRSEAKNYSKSYWPGGVIKTLAEMEAEGDASRSILISNMRTNDWKCVVFSRYGNWPQPFDPATAEVLPLVSPEAA